MVLDLVKILNYKRPSQSGDWCQRIPPVAQKLELLLYATAKSAAAYGDRRTLHARLQCIARCRRSASSGIASITGPHVAARSKLLDEQEEP